MFMTLKHIRITKKVLKGQLSYNDLSIATPISAISKARSLRLCLIDSMSHEKVTLEKSYQDITKASGESSVTLGSKLVMTKYSLIFPNSQTTSKEEAPLMVKFNLESCLTNLSTENRWNKSFRIKLRWPILFGM